MDPEVNEIIARYKENLQGLGIHVKKILLYGSYAAGNPREHSDIDLIVISQDFKNMGLWDRLGLLGRARVKLRRPMEILGYTEEEFDAQGRGTFIGDEVKTRGIEVA